MGTLACPAGVLPPRPREGWLRDQPHPSAVPDSLRDIAQVVGKY